MPYPEFDIDLIVHRLDGEMLCGLGLSRIFSAASYESLFNGQTPVADLPRICVIDQGVDVTGPLGSGYDRVATEKFALVTSIQDSPSERGLNAISNCKEIRSAFFDSLNRWSPGGRWGPVLFAGNANNSVRIEGDIYHFVDEFTTQMPFN